LLLFRRVAGAFPTFFGAICLPPVVQSADGPQRAGAGTVLRPYLRRRGFVCCSVLAFFSLVVAFFDAIVLSFNRTAPADRRVQQ
jgi:hypothetical protein